MTEKDYVTAEQASEGGPVRKKRRKVPAALDEQLSEVDKMVQDAEKISVRQARLKKVLGIPEVKEENPQGSEEGTAGFDPTGVASFVHGQFTATLRILEDKKKHWKKLRLWAIAARKKRFYKLADFLDTYVNSEGGGIEEEEKSADPIRALILEAKKLDDMLHGEGTKQE